MPRRLRRHLCDGAALSKFYRAYRRRLSRLLALFHRGIVLAVLAVCGLLAVYAVLMLVRYPPARRAAAACFRCSPFSARACWLDALASILLPGFLFTGIGGFGIIWQCAIMRFYSDRNAAAAIFWAYLISGGLAAVAAIVMVETRLPVDPVRHRSTGAPPVPSFCPGELAGYLIVLLPIAYALGCYRLDAQAESLGVERPCSSVWSRLALTYSRAGWMGFAAACAFLLAVRTRRGLAGAAARSCSAASSRWSCSSTRITIRAKTTRACRFGKPRCRSPIAFR